MTRLRRQLERFPRLKRLAKAVYSMIQRTPKINYSEITADQIGALVGRSDPVILEIGCNDGTHTLRFLEIFSNPTIYCFEPDPRAAERFRKNVGARPNVHLFEMAVSDREGEITFFQSSGHREARDEIGMPKGWDLSGSIRKPTGHIDADPRITFTRTLTVPTARLDSWCEAHGIDRIDFLWMDVQGGEGDVFKGGQRALARTRILYTECCDTEQYEGQLTTKHLLSTLEKFEVLVRYPNDVLLRNKHVND